MAESNEILKKSVAGKTVPATLAFTLAFLLPPSLSSNGGLFADAEVIQLTPREIAQ
jgi:hypothetical protein